LAELEQFQRLTVGRELKVIEVKKEIERLQEAPPAKPSQQGIYTPETEDRPYRQSPWPWPGRRS
jgi:hypothetical protein